MKDLDFSGQITTVRLRCLEATQSLLGDTISLTEEEWRGPSLIPGWSRAHVAAHLTANAVSLRRLVVSALELKSVSMYVSAEEKFRQIHRGAEHDPLQLQINLDTAASELDSAYDAVHDWTAPVDIAGRAYNMSSVPLLRLREVVLHHLDLNTGFSVSDIAPVPARWLLQLAIARNQKRTDLPAIRVESDSGVQGELGSIGERQVVMGSDSALWAWVLGRGSFGNIAGHEGLSIPFSP